MITIVKVPLLGEERDFAISMATVRAVRTQTGFKLLGTSIKDLLEVSDEVVPVLLYEGLLDKGGFESADELAAQMAPGDLADVLDPIIHALIGDAQYQKNKAAGVPEKNAPSPVKKKPAANRLN